MTSMMARLNVLHGEPLEALDALTTVIHRLLNAGNLTILRNAVAILAGLLDRFDRHAPAAQILGFAIDTFVSASIPETAITIAHLRERLGDEQFEALCRTGAAMTTAEMVEFVENEIADLRAEITST